MNIDVALKTNINGSTAKTSSTYADTDLIQLYDNQGNPNGKIAKSVFMESVKASLPGLLTDQTSVSDLLGLNSGALSKITASNLASVLGVDISWKHGYYNLTGDFDNYTDTGLYRYNGYEHAISNSPYGGNSVGVLLVLNYTSGSTDIYGNKAFQKVIFDDQNAHSVYRYKKSNGTWTAWAAADNFGCSTPADLASLLGGLKYVRKMGTSDDMNNFTSTATYKIDSNLYPTNFPETLKTGTPSAFLEIVNGEEIIIQKVFTLLGGFAWRSYYRSMTTWSAWRIVPNNGNS